jgi:hypothetical protein
VRIQKLKLRLRGVDEATARSLASGLGNAIAAALDMRSLRNAGGQRIGRMDLGSISATPGATAEAIRAQVATAVGKAVNGPAESQTGGAA